MQFCYRLLLFFLALNLSTIAQQRNLEVLSLDDPSLLRQISYKKIVDSELQLQKELQTILGKCYDNAFLGARYDSVLTDSLKTTAFLHFGGKYKWAKLSKGNVDEGVLSEIGFREKLFQDKPISYKNVRRVQERLLQYYENNGYPFAEIKMDSIIFYENSISAVLWLEKNTEEKIDSILIKGNAKISGIYIYNYLGIKPGSPYNESMLRKVNTRLRELPFISMTKPSAILFTSTKNKLVLHLDKKKSSQFDGILGVLPDNKTGKIIFTGDVRLKLQNGLSRGELIELNWRRLQTQTQDLRIHFVYPFLFQTPFGIDYIFKLYKKDTTFIDINQNIGLQYLLMGGNYVKIFYKNKTSSLLTTKGLEFVSTLPPYADVQTNMYGLGWHVEALDYRLNPRRGYFFTINAGAGTRRIRKNAKVNPEVYDDLELSTTQYNTDLEAGAFFSMGARAAFLVKNQSALIEGKTLFQNELFRIGGLKSLRGFDEESIFASAYSTFTLEYRYLLEQNSYLYIFVDQSWWENKSVTDKSENDYVYDTPTGFGAGISFETKAGIFSISYALGRQFDNPIQLKGGKVHFGIVNYF